MKSCKTCRWCGCREYGKGFGYCEKYIPDLNEAKREEKEREKRNKETNIL